MKNFTHWDIKNFKSMPVMYDSNTKVLQDLDMLYGRTDLMLIYFIKNFPLRRSEQQFYSSDDISFLESINLGNIDARKY